MGAGVIDRLRQIGVPNVFEVNFGSQGRDAEWANGVRIKTANTRAEILASMRSWLIGGASPTDQHLMDDLPGVAYGYDPNQRLLLEKKEHIERKSTRLNSSHYCT